MIKAFDIDGGVNLSGSSSHGNNPEGELDDDDDEGNDGNDSCMSSGNAAHKKSFKHHVFVNGLIKNRGAGELTPKSH